MIKYSLPWLLPRDKNKRALRAEDLEGVILRSNIVTPQVLIIQPLFHCLANLAHLLNYNDYEIA